MSAAEVLNPHALIPCKRKCFRKRKTKNNRERERERERERAEHNFKIISRLCTHTMLSSTIYTSPLGTDRSTMYFNAHTSIWHLLRDYSYLVVYPILGFRLDFRLRIAPGLHCLPVRLLTIIPIRFARSVSLTGSGLFSRSGSGWACHSTVSGKNMVSTTTRSCRLWQDLLTSGENDHPSDFAWHCGSQRFGAYSIRC